MNGEKRRFGRRIGARSLALLLAALPLQAEENPVPEEKRISILDEVVVTATSRAEARRNFPGTVQIVEQEEIERSPGKSLTDLLAENAVGFFSEWTPGQTSINIRGGASDGQGRDFRGQVLVLVNGRRAGTANLSKLSLGDVARVEIVRGPSSIVYGSQNIGGVINIILKTGARAPGTLVDLVAGSWGLLQGRAQTGGEKGPVDYYVGASGSSRNDYHSGEGGTKMVNTAWRRAGATAALGWQLHDRHRVDLTLRTDGVYDAGFRGSGSNLYSEDDRTNRSFDLTYEGRTESETLAWRTHLYSVTDVDDFRWASPVVRSGNLPVPGTSVDYNYRELDILGNRLQPRVRPWKGNDLLVGWDWETSRLRSDRIRVGVNEPPPIAQIAPFDNNQSEEINSFYLEDSQHLLEDRLTVRGGVRYTMGRTSFERTPNVTSVSPKTVKYDDTTWAVGAAYDVTPNLAVRFNAGTGFRAPTASELAADFTALGGGRIFGNPNLEPESSEQLEAGVAFSARAWHADLAWFRNEIKDRIRTQTRPGDPNTSDWVNNPAPIVVEGVELQVGLDVLRALRSSPSSWHWTVQGGGYFHYDMIDKGSAPTANTTRPQRIYEYHAAVGTRLGQGFGGRRNWSVNLGGVLRGPMWYDTEESLLVPQGEPNRSFIHEKKAFWIWSAGAEVKVSRTREITVFAAVSNLLDENEHPIFIGLDVTPSIVDPAFQNGGLGTSMPGRAIQGGVRYSF